MFRFTEENRATNPVIGIVLLIGVAVILSAAIGTFLIGLSSDLNGGTQAAVETSTVVTDDTDGFVTVTGISMQRADQIAVEATVADGTDALEDASGNGTFRVTKEIDTVDESVTFRQHAPPNGDVAVEIVAVAHRADGDHSARILSTEVTI
ncbi:type IV pilin [Halosolutus amylolyticus]|uniref:Type IV pilin n=1 Tax=Halosolutus amylolyticus TaxID=2932267 RepID=A0ABD5PKW1_9EURY|nr:type IV pilin N-terminal domain-containing protein [Halosolutus amylolyticus]